MDARDLQQIDAFLSDLGQASLLEYYGIAADTPPDEVKSRVKTKRSWAQAQQANPKFRYQALWLIKNNSLVQRVLVTEMRAYVEAVAARERDRKLQMLDLFVQGSLVSGRLSSESESAIRRQASEMGLTDAETTRYLEEKVGGGDQESLFDSNDPKLAPKDDNFTDYYDLLQITPQATAEEVEEAYRERYRWARTLKDLQRANEIYRQIEQAWRILSDLNRRRDYDDQRSKRERVSTAPRGAPEVPAGLRTSAERHSEPVPNAPKSGNQPLEFEPPSEIQMGRPAWAQDTPERSGNHGDPLRLTKPANPPKPTHGPARPTPALERPKPEPSAPMPGPPPDFRSRTFQPGTPDAPAKPRHTPQLSVEGPDQITLGLLLKPVVRTITVRNSGKGRLRGNVASSQPWLQVAPRTLHLKDESQVIELKAFPSRLPGRSGRARVTISTTHGERWATNVDAYKRRVVRIVGGALVLLVLFGLVLAKLGVIKGVFPDPEPVVIHTILQLDLDPAQSAIFLNDMAAGKGPERIFMDQVVPGAPLVLRIEHPGHEPYMERMVFVDRQRIRRAVKLVDLGLGPSYAIDQDTQRKLVSGHGLNAPAAPSELPVPTPKPVREPSPDPPVPAEPTPGAPSAPQNAPRAEP